MQAVSGGGSIVVLDSATFEPFAVTKAVSIIASEGITPIVKASLTSSAIEVRAANESVILIRGLIVEGERTPPSGGQAVPVIRLFGGKLTLLDSIVRHSAGAGVSASPGTRIFLQGATFDDVSGLALGGATTIITGCRFVNIGGPISVAGGSAVIKNSIITGLGTDRGDGVTVSNQDTRGADVLLEDVLITNTRIALQTSISAAGAGSQVVARVLRSTISGNEEGLATKLGGSILSSGTNLIRGNATNGTFSGNIPLE